jgi:aldose 1-epimerase
MHTSFSPPSSLRLSSARKIIRTGAAAAVAIGTTGVLALSSAPATAAPAGCGAPTVTKQFFGRAFDSYVGHSLPVDRYTLSNCHGVQIRIITYGATTQSIVIPGRNGKLANIALGFRTLHEYVTEDSPPQGGGTYFGETIGRYGNRIAKGTFVLDGVRYHLPINNNGNSLHGGTVGFGNHVYKAHAVRTAGSAGVALTIVSPDGDQGYPGRLVLTVTYRLDSSNALSIHYHATTSKDTVFNPTNHSYFNMAGEASGTVYNQEMIINANRYTPTDKTQIPTGRLAPVAGTPFDFRTAHTIGSRINVANRQLLIGQGYDHNWVLNNPSTKPGHLTFAAAAWDPVSGRQIKVFTDQPGVQFYTGNQLLGTLRGKSGRLYRQGDAFCLETQHWPDSPNHPDYPSTVLRPQETFRTSTVYRFTTR